MTLASLNTAMAWPGVVFLTGTPTLGTHQTLDAAGEYSAMVICAQQDMVISHVGARIGTVAGAPTADFRIETVATDGTPSGTLWATNTNGASGTLTSNSNPLVALTASASITKGQLFAVKILYSSGTSFITQRLGSMDPQSALPYLVTNVTGSAVKSALNLAIGLVLGSSSTTFYSIRAMWPVTTFTANAFNNTSSARRGVRFQVPFKCRVVGLRWWNSTSTGDFNAAIFDDAGAELSSSSTAFDGDGMLNGAGASNNVYFDNAVTLSPGTWYRAALEPSSATNITIATVTLPSANYLSAFPGGANFHYTTYVASSWTDTATDQVPLIDLLIDQLDDGTGSGGTTARVIGG